LALGSTNSPLRPLGRSIRSMEPPTLCTASLQHVCSSLSAWTNSLWSQWRTILSTMRCTTRQRVEVLTSKVVGTQIPIYTNGKSHNVTANITSYRKLHRAANEGVRLCTLGDCPRTMHYFMLFKDCFGCEYLACARACACASLLVRVYWARIFL
jgi:hypothetical protein